MMKSFFSKPFQLTTVLESRGFTLLEVMIAVSLIAIALVTLIGSQSQSVSLATGSRFDTMASLLARQKMTELSLQEYASVHDSEGDFGEDWPGFIWKTKVTELTEDQTGIKKASERLKTVDLTVIQNQAADMAFSLRTVLFKEPETVK